MDEIDLGNGYTARWFPWSPDRRIKANADRYKGIPDIEHALLEIRCPHGNRGCCHPDTPEVRKVFTNGTFWTLHSLDPLHIEPSVQFMKYDPDTKQHVPGCCHGWIRNGRWVNA